MPNYLKKLLEKYFWKYIAKLGLKMSGLKLWIANRLLKVIIKYTEKAYEQAHIKIKRIYRKIKGKKKSDKVTEARKSGDKDKWIDSIDDL